MKIIIWTGPAWETWGPEALQTGLGGSEIAAIHMASELSRWGHEIEVIGQVTPCVHEGVKYRSFHQFGEKSIECDVFISSRNLSVLRRLKPRAKISVLWCHDIHVGDDYQGFMREYDIILCLSQWSKKVLSSYYNDVPKDKFVVTRNGLDTRLFLREPKKEGCRAIYSSSPDRGLDHLLDYWPKIRQIREDAELHVYYGFDTWQKMTNIRKDKNAQVQIDFFKDRLKQLEEYGVVSHGRVGQVELAKAWLSSSMWLYPTSFLETSCISAMEAQAAGSLPITTKLAALSETVKYGVLIYPPNTDSRYEEEFLCHTREFIKRPTSDLKWTTMMREGREWALRNLSWTQVAQQWEELFAEKIRSK